MTDATIILPPRAFVYTAVFVFESDTRTDAQLREDILRAVSIASSMAGHGRAIGVQPTAVAPPGVKQ